ncbi:glycosyltransferase [Fusobacterium sp.]|uniref:glycosyltransferase n=1 Tax=Fusobacterium sp. TaxID=68766 RepID=UPI00396C37AC
MNTKKVELSIIVPIYNVEKYLNECLKHVYDIKGIQKEVILVNDGSPDNSKKIIDKYYIKYKDETIVINQENSGLSVARNAGLKKARGEYVFFLDSDDYIDAIKFKELFSYTKTEDLDIGIGRAIKFWENKKISSCDIIPKIPDKLLQKNIISGFKYFDICLKERAYNVEVWNKIYKRKFLKLNNLQFISGILHEDIPFSFSTFIIAPKVKAYNIPFYYYRQRSGSIMGNISEKNYVDMLKIIRYLVMLFQEHSINNRNYNRYLVSFLYSIYKIFNKVDKTIFELITNEKDFYFIEKLRLFMLKRKIQDE